MDILIQRSKEMFDVVNQSDVSVGDEFFYGLNQQSQPIKRAITEVLEQRKERGEYKDESNRRMWAKVNTKIIPTIKV